MNASILKLVRCFFPSWRFFEEVGALPLIEYRVSEGPWRRGLPPGRRSFNQLVFNPEGNLQFAAHSLVELLFMEAQEVLESGGSPEDIKMTVSYGLVCRLVVSKIRENGEFQTGLSVQFRLVADQAPHELFFQSAVHGWDQICSL